MLFSAAGLVCTLLILIVFVTLKDHPVIKASSRGLSCVLLVGIMVSYGENFLDLIAPGNSSKYGIKAEKPYITQEQINTSVSLGFKKSAHILT